MNKYEVVRELVLADERAHGSTRLLDVGCRDCILQTHLPATIAYEGVDLFQNEQGTVVHVLNVERGLPFPDRAFDVVTALDLLEHLDNFHGGLVELLRVARRRVIVALPNTSHLTFRLDYLLHGRFTSTNKYDLTIDTGLDRHRWLVPLTQSDACMRAMAGSDWNLRIQRLAPGKRAGSFARAGRALGLSPAWWAWSVIYDFARP